MVNQCPWDTLDPTTLNFCEEALCGWIRQPANTWSNLAYVLVGAYLTADGKAERGPWLRAIGPMAIIIGIMSFFYHASLTFVGEVFDLGSMFLFASLLVVFNLERLGWLGRKGTLVVYLLVNALSLFVMIQFKTVGIFVFGILVFLALGMEAVMFFSGSTARSVSRRNAVFRASYRFLGMGLAVFLVSYAVWLLDFHKIVCDPRNHFVQGHALWHVLNSSVFIFLARFYGQFDDQLGRVR